MSEVASQCRLVYSEKVTAESHQIMDNTATMNNNTNQDSKSKTSRLFFILQSVATVIAIIVGLATLGVWYLDNKFESVYRHLNTEFAGVYRHMDGRIGGVYQHMDSRFDLESRFDHVNARIDELKPGIPERDASECSVFTRRQQSIIPVHTATAHRQFHPDIKFRTPHKA